MKVDSFQKWRLDQFCAQLTCDCKSCGSFQGKAPPWLRREGEKGIKDEIYDI